MKRYVYHFTLQIKDGTGRVVTDVSGIMNPVTKMAELEDYDYFVKVATESAEEKMAEKGLMKPYTVAVSSLVFLHEVGE